MSTHAHAPGRLSRWLRRLGLALAFLFTLALIIGAFFFGTLTGIATNIFRPAAAPMVFSSSGATVEHVRALKLLTVMSFQITTDLEGQAARRKGVWLAKGSADYVVDFSKAEVLAHDDKTRTLTLLLPAPAVRNARLDPLNTRLLSMENTGLGWWTLGAMGSDDEFTRESRRQLQIRIENAAKEPWLKDAARGAAVQLVTAIYAPVNYTVRIAWDDAPAVEQAPQALPAIQVQTPSAPTAIPPLPPANAPLTAPAPVPTP
jgi:hypothetical protein